MDFATAEKVLRGEVFLNRGILPSSRVESFRVSKHKAKLILLQEGAPMGMLNVTTKRDIIFSTGDFSVPFSVWHTTTS